MTTTARQNPYRTFGVTLSRRERLSPHFVRLTFTGAELDQHGTVCLDQRVKLVLADGEQVARAVQEPDWYAWWLALPDAERPVMRTYTARRVRPEAGEVDVDVAVHGTEGPASAFAQQAPIGSPLLLVGPDVGVAGSDEVGLAWKPGPATEVLLAGDETALPAILNIVEQLPARTTGRVLLEVPDLADACPVQAPEGVELVWLGRDGRTHGQALLAAVEDWAADFLTAAPGGGEELDEQGEILWDEAETGTGRYVWVAAETKVVADIRRLLVKERGLDRRSASFMGYWRRGRAG